MLNEIYNKPNNKEVEENNLGVNIEENSEINKHGEYDGESLNKETVMKIRELEEVLEG